MKLAIDRILRDPSPEEVQGQEDLIEHRADAPIIVSAMQAEVDFLVAHNRRHFIDDPAAAERSGLQIGTPGDALDWLRGRGVLE